jgi:hypothetical protein
VRRVRRAPLGLRAADEARELAAIDARAGARRLAVR